AWTKVMNLAGTPTVNALWGTNANNVYAVGDSAMIVHYTGTNFALMSSAAPLSTRFYGVWGASSDVWVVGSSSYILHSTGGTWSFERQPAEMGVNEDLNAVWASSGTDAYAVGASGTILRRKANGQWDSDALPGFVSVLSAAWGSSANDVYLAGDGWSILHKTS